MLPVTLFRLLSPTEELKFTPSVVWASGVLPSVGGSQSPQARQVLSPSWTLMWRTPGGADAGSLSATLARLACLMCVSERELLLSHLSLTNQVRSGIIFLLFAFLDVKKYIWYTLEPHYMIGLPSCRQDCKANTHIASHIYITANYVLDNPIHHIVSHL